MVITFKLWRFFLIMSEFIKKIELKVTFIIKDGDRLSVVTQSNFCHVSQKAKYCSFREI